MVVLPAARLVHLVVIHHLMVLLLSVEVAVVLMVAMRQLMVVLVAGVVVTKALITVREHNHLNQETLEHMVMATMAVPDLVVVVTLEVAAVAPAQ